MATSKTQSKKATTTRARRKTTKEAAKPETAPEAAPTGDDGDTAAQTATEPEAPARRARRRKKATVATATADTVPAAEPAEEAACNEERFLPVHADHGDGRIETLGDLSGAYCRALEDEGKSETTVRSYRSDLALALSILGADTRLADLTAEMVAGFNEHPRVTHTHDGHPKAKSGLLKHRRVLRLSLSWAAEQGHIDEAPLPENGDAA